MRFGSVADVEQALRGESYLPDRGLATAIYLSVAMGRPLLLEGEAGVGKTEVGKTLARILEADLIRLQCYEGIDASQALYEWDYARQLLYARALQEGEVTVGERVSELYGPEFLVERPLLRAIRAGSRAVLLVDELDRADDEFEAFLLEVLSDFTRDRARAGDDRRRRAARRRHHLEPHAGAPRRAQAPLPLPLDRVPRRGARGGDHPAAGAGGRGAAGALGGGDGVAAARSRPGEAPGRRGGDRLGDGAVAARRGVRERRRRQGDARRRGEEPGRPGQGRSGLGRARQD